MAAEQDATRLKSWYELSSEFRSGLNLPRLDLHVYSDDPQSRFILVNLKKYREGERLPNGLVLEEILPSNLPPNIKTTRNICCKKKAIKVSEQSHAFILDEMVHCDQLECNPNQVCVDDEDGENDVIKEDSDDEDDDDEEEE